MNLYNLIESRIWHGLLKSIFACNACKFVYFNDSAVHAVFLHWLVFRRLLNILSLSIIRLCFRVICSFKYDKLDSTEFNCIALHPHPRRLAPTPRLQRLTPSSHPPPPSLSPSWLLPMPTARRSFGNSPDVSRLCLNFQLFVDCKCYVSRVNGKRRSKLVCRLYGHLLEIKYTFDEEFSF